MAISFRYLDPGNEERVITSSDELWTAISMDEWFDWGTTSSSLGTLELRKGKTLRSQLFISKHPDSLWYFQHCDRLNGTITVLHDSARNDSNWAQSYLNPEDVHMVDDDGVVWVKLSVCGDLAFIRHSCFIVEKSAELVVKHFFDHHELLPALNWTDDSVAQSQLDSG